MAWVAAETQVQSLAQGTSHAPSAAEKKKKVIILSLHSTEEWNLNTPI